MNTYLLIFQAADMSPWTCKLWQTAENWSMTLIITHIFFILVEVTLSVVNPMIRQRLQDNFKMAILIIWLVAFLFIIPPLIFNLLAKKSSIQLVECLLVTSTYAFLKPIFVYCLPCVLSFCLLFYASHCVERQRQIGEELCSENSSLNSNGHLPTSITMVRTAGDTIAITTQPATPDTDISKPFSIENETSPKLNEKSSETNIITNSINNNQNSKIETGDYSNTINSPSKDEHQEVNLSMKPQIEEEKLENSTENAQKSDIKQEKITEVSQENVSENNEKSPDTDLKVNLKTSKITNERNDSENSSKGEKNTTNEELNDQHRSETNTSDHQTAATTVSDSCDNLAKLEKKISQEETQESNSEKEIDDDKKFLKPSCDNQVPEVSKTQSKNSFHDVFSKSVSEDDPNFDITNYVPDKKPGKQQLNAKRRSLERQSLVCEDDLVLALDNPGFDASLSEEIRVKDHPERSASVDAQPSKRENVRKSISLDEIVLEKDPKLRPRPSILSRDGKRRQGKNRKSVKFGQNEMRTYNVKSGAMSPVFHEDDLKNQTTLKRKNTPRYPRRNSSLQRQNALENGDLNKTNGTVKPQKSVPYMRQVSQEQGTKILQRTRQNSAILRLAKYFLVSSIFLTLPFLVIEFGCSVSEQFRQETSSITILAFKWTFISLSIIHPLIIYSLNADVRKAFKQTCCSK